MVNFKPTRLLKIKRFQLDGTLCVQLYQTYGQDVAPYAALSYCWGGNQPIKMTSENICQHLTRLNYTKMPATIRDAITITITWRLGTR